MAKSPSLSQNYNKKYSASYWGTEIENARKRHENTLWKEAQESIKVYNTRAKQIGSMEVLRRVNVWWYIVQTLLPAYYSSTPKAEVNLRKYSGSTMMDMSAVLLERNLQFSMDMDFDFDFVGLNSGLQFLLTGRGILWSRYNPDFGEETPAVFKATDTGIVDADGMPYSGDLADLDEQEDGSLSMNVPKITGQRAVLESLHYTDYLNSDARNEEEIVWRARQAFLTQDQVADQFGSDMVKQLKFDSFPDTTREERSIKTDDRNSRDGKAALWEIWCEDEAKVYWCQSKGSKSIVESGDVPIQYPGFYPCSVINASLDPDSTIPVSDYTHAKDQILSVERIAERKHMLITAIAPNGVYDATLGDPMQQLFTGFAKMIPITNWPSHTARGGANGRMEFLDISPYVNALQVLTQEEDNAKQALFQMLKVSDLMQGVSNPTKTATANRLENQWSSMGLIVRQNQFAKFIGDGLEKLGTVIASQFDAQRLLDNGNAQELLSPLVTPEMPIEVLMQQIVEPLKNSAELFQFQIASDSMVAIDERQERADTADLLNSAGGFFDKMQGMVQQYPAMMPLAIKMFEKMIRSYKGGKELEAVFTQTLSQVAAQAQAQQNQPPQPDPKVIESQTKMQIAQMDAQGRAETNQLEVQKLQMEMQLEQMKEEATRQLAMAKGQLDEWVAQQDIQLRSRALEIQVLKIQADAGSQQADIALKEKIAAIDTLLQQQSMKLDSHERKLSLDEHLLEEKRLAADTTIEAHKVAQKDVELGIKAKEVQVKEKIANKPAPKPTSSK